VNLISPKYTSIGPRVNLIWQREIQVSNPKKTNGLLSNDKKGLVFPYTNRYDKKGFWSSIFPWKPKRVLNSPSSKTLTPHPFPPLPSTPKHCVNNNQGPLVGWYFLPLSYPKLTSKAWGLWFSKLHCKERTIWKRSWPSLSQVTKDVHQLLLCCVIFNLVWNGQIL
jgi:hypothetical protein